MESDRARVLLFYNTLRDSIRSSYRSHYRFVLLSNFYFEVIWSDISTVTPFSVSAQHVATTTVCFRTMAGGQSAQLA